MEPITSTNGLNEAIRNLETKQGVEKAVLEGHIHQAYESVKPGHLLRSAINEVVASPEIRGNIVNASLGLTAGYLTKKIIVGGSRNPLTNIIGIVAEVGVTSLVARHNDSIRSFGAALLRGYINIRKSSRRNRSRH